MLSEPSSPTLLTHRKREAILQAAISEFRAHGFAGTSMDRVAAVAEVSKRTVYNHFPSKEVLFDETLVQLFQTAAASQERAYRSDLPLRAQLTELIEAKVATLADASMLELSRVAIAQALHAPERARAIMARLGEREEGVTRWIRAALADGKLTPCDPAFAAMLLQGQVKAVAFWPQVAMGAAPLDQAAQAQLVEAAVSMFLGYFAQAKQTA